MSLVLDEGWTNTNVSQAVLHSCKKETQKVFQKPSLLTLGAHAQRGLRYLVCVSVCLSTLILALQATRWLMSDTDSFSTTKALEK